MQDMVANKLATVSVNDNLSTFKYHRKVMFDRLWDKYPDTMECRGHTYDNTTGELVVAAPRKSFNYLENGWGSDLELNTHVGVAKKYNGFLACVSKHNGEIIISTTGSTKSDFVKMAKEVFAESESEVFYNPSEQFTDFYEIIHDSDPHIVDEGKQKAIWLGSRSKKDGIPIWNFEGTGFMTFGEALELAKTDRGEGFMVYDVRDYSKAIKLKTPYYVGKKKLMRASEKQVEQMYNDCINYASNNLPEMWHYVPALICAVYEKELWLELSDQERRAALEVMNK